jgi:hypothetical protein
MNDERRKKLQVAASALSDACAIVEEIMDEEQEALDNLPEGMQQGEKGEKMGAAIGALNEAKDSIESALGNIDTACE